MLLGQRLNSEIGYTAGRDIIIWPSAWVMPSIKMATKSYSDRSFSISFLSLRERAWINRLQIHVYEKPKAYPTASLHAL